MRGQPMPKGHHGIFVRSKQPQQDHSMIGSPDEKLFQNFLSLMKVQLCAKNQKKNQTVKAVRPYQLCAKIRKKHKR